MLDPAWRIVMGQAPYIDFILTCGPLHFYICAFFIKLFGFSKMAFLAHVLVVSSLCILTTAWILFKRLPGYAFLVSVFLSAVVFYWPMSHPWYTQSALLCLVFIIALWFHDDANPNSISTYYLKVLATGFLCIICFFIKPNIGALAGIYIMGLWLLSPKKIQTLLGLAIGGIIVIALVRLFFIPSFTAFIDQTVTNYAAVSSHKSGLLSIFTPSGWLINYFWLPALLVGLNAQLLAKLPLKRLWLFFALWPISMLLNTTSGSLWWADIPLMGVYVGLAYALLYEIRDMGIKRKLQNIIWHLSTGALTFFATLFLVLFIYFGFVIESWSWPYMGFLSTSISVNPKGDYASKSEKIKGWLMDSDQGQALDALVDFFDKASIKDGSLLILSDMQILYPLINKEPYPGIPWAFVHKLIPNKGPQTQQIQQNILNNPPDWILTHERPVPFIGQITTTLGIDDFIKNNYVLVKREWKYVVLKKISVK